MRGKAWKLGDGISTDHIISPGTISISGPTSRACQTYAGV